MKAVPSENAAPALRDVSPLRVRREARILPGVPAGRPAEQGAQTELFDVSPYCGERVETIEAALYAG